MKLPGDTPVTPAEQTATVKLPKRIKPKGKTVLLKKTVTTNAGQKATAKVTWSTKKTAEGSSKKYANLETNKAGKVAIRTTGKAKKLYVKLSLKAPAVPGYQAYSHTKKWTVKSWETGARAPKPPTQVRLAQALGLRFDDLEVPGPADADDLRRLRESLGWTQREAAERLRLERSVLKRVEAGEELPPDPKRMARVYGVTAAELAAVVRRTG